MRPVTEAAVTEAEEARDRAVLARVAAHEAATKVEDARDAVAAEIAASDALERVDARGMVEAENNRRKHRRLQAQWQDLAYAYRAADVAADDAQHRVEYLRKQLSDAENAIATARGQEAAAVGQQAALESWATMHGVSVRPHHHG